MKKSTLFIFIFILISFGLFAQEHDHDAHSHGDSKFEFGFSSGFAKLIDEDVIAPSAHLHLLRKIGSKGILERISFGPGFEYIFSEHTHYSIVGTFSLNPFHAIKLDISPGVLITEHEDDKEQQFVTHVELTYEFHYHNFGFGPVIGYGLAKEDNHFMLGIHLGFGL